MPAGYGGGVGVYATDPTQLILDIDEFLQRTFEGAGLLAELHGRAARPAELSNWAEPTARLYSEAPTSMVVANAPIVPAGSGGSVRVFAKNDTDLVIDINATSHRRQRRPISLQFGRLPCWTRIPPGPLLRDNVQYGHRAYNKRLDQRVWL